MQTVRELRRREPDVVRVSERLAEEARKWQGRPAAKASPPARPGTSVTARSVRFDRD